MSFTIPDVRRMTAAAAAALMFTSSAAPALAGDPSAAMVVTSAVAAAKPHPIMKTGNNDYVFKLSQQLVRDTGDKTSSLRARNFASELETMLAQPADQVRFLGVPNPAANGQIVISAMVPPQSLYATANIPVCVEGPVKDAQGNVLNTSQVIATYNITPAGEVVPYKYDGQVSTASAGFAFACKQPMLAARAKMMEAAVAAAQPQPAPSVVVPDKRVSLEAPATRVASAGPQ